MNKRKSLFFDWFPILPFLLYWASSYFMFHFGVFTTLDLNWYTHFYFVAALMIFAISYKGGLNSDSENYRVRYRADPSHLLALLKTSTWLTLLGTCLFVYDRVSSGAGSVELIQNDLANVREEFSTKTTMITTLAVIPQSFRILAFASYFYCLMNRIIIPKNIHFALYCTAILEIANMALTANRGALLWLFTYIMFYVVFCAKVNILSEIFNVRDIGKKLFIVIFCVFSIFYFYYVAKNREISSTQEYLGLEASYLLKDSSDFSNTDYADLGAKYSLYYYFTHGFQYMDAILSKASILNFDFISPLGMRVEVQIKRFFPDYIHPAKSNIVEWVAAAGFSVFGWPTVFGASLAYFGIIGSFVFFGLLGYFSGYAVHQSIKSKEFGWFIIVFTLYASLNMSFDWILRDFDQFVALFVGFYYVSSERKFRYAVL